MEINEFVRDFEMQMDDLTPGSLTSSTEFKRLDSWDSMNVLVVIAMVDKKYNKQLNTRDFEQSDTLEDLFRVVKGK